MKNLLSRFMTDESGAAAIEYALICALIALGIIGGATALGTAISGKLSSVGASVTSAK